MVARILQSAQAKGKKPVPSVFKHGDVFAQRAQYVMNATDGAIESDTDIIEMMPIPEFCVPVSYRLLTEGTLTGETADVGIMSGTWGSLATDRTVGAEFFNDLDLTIRNSPGDTAANAAPYLLEPTAAERSIGIGGFGSDIAMATSIKFTLIVEFACLAPLA